MARTVCVLICVCVLATLATAQNRLLDLYEDDICHQEGKTLWTCKHHRNCPSLIPNLKKGKRPPVCGFEGQNKKDPVVCCEPEQVTSATRGAKSKEMCKKYAESVNVRFGDAEDGGFTISTCHAVEPVIVNGVDAEAQEYPHMALVGYGRKEKIAWLCGGSLVSERFVISAAHCTNTNKGPAKWVRLGEYDKDSTVDDEQSLARPTDYEIIERINHPGYKSPIVFNDIALYKLERDVEINEYVRPICLQVDHQFSKTYAIATGWGRTEWGGRGSAVLQKVNLTITPRKDCSDAYLEASKGDKLKDGIRDESMLCAGDTTSGKDTCQGDSGGPLQIRLKDPYCMYSLVGITSFGRMCGTNTPGVYTRVSHFVPWIESVVWP